MTTSPPLDGRMTSFPSVSAALTGDELMWIVQPGNAAQGVLYNVTVNTLSNFFAVYPFASPPPIGNVTPNTGAFTALNIPAGTLGRATNGNLTPQLANGSSALSIIATQPAIPGNSTRQNVVYIIGYGSGTANTISRVVQVNYQPGYTGPANTIAINAGNQNAGTGINYSLQGGTSGATSGVNIGVSGGASSAVINIGTQGQAINPINSGTNIGGSFHAINTGSSPTQIGLWTSLAEEDGPTAPAVSAAFIADNAAQSAPVALFQVNGVTEAQIDEAGNILTTGYLSADMSSIINMNTGTPQALPTSTLGLHVVAPDTIIPSIVLDAYGANAGVQGRAWGGTQASPTAITSGTNMLSLGGFGYDGTAISPTSAAQVRMYAAENWGSTAHGTYISFRTTPKATTTIEDAMRIQASGGVSIGPDGVATDPGKDNLYVAGNVQAPLTTPSSSSAAGTAGTIVWDANYVYVCTATNTWKRAALSGF